MNAPTNTTLHPLGLVLGLSNEEYHAGPGVSKSQLDQIAESPATYMWAKHAPIDEEKLKAFDMGSATHCRILEPDEFNDRFIIAPKFKRRTDAGKADEAEFLENCAKTGKTVISAEDGRKLELMRDSVFAHPDARWLLEQAGHSEASFYWIDPETGELCRIRPDRHLTEHPIIIDVKTVADMGRFEQHVEEFRYHVQDAMYSEGFHRVTGEWPDFVFIAVSTSISCGRYPVRVRPLTDDWKEAGKDLFRRDLNRFNECRINDDWHDFKPLLRPAWAARKAA